MIESSFFVKMKLNKNYKNFIKRQVVEVIVVSYNNNGAIFREYEEAIDIPEKYLDVLTKVNDPEYFLWATKQPRTGKISK